MLLRGLLRRCPRCGEGRLFRGWMKLRERCPECGLRYLLNQGDPWAFILSLDRAFLIVIIAIAYFKFWPRTLPPLLVLFGGIIVLFIATTPNRYGVCVALDYWTRARWGDEARPVDSPNG